MSTKWLSGEGDEEDGDGDGDDDALDNDEDVDDDDEDDAFFGALVVVDGDFIALPATWACFDALPPSCCPVGNTPGSMTRRITAVAGLWSTEVRPPRRSVEPPTLPAAPAPAFASR